MTATLATRVGNYVVLATATVATISTDAGEIVADFDVNRDGGTETFHGTVYFGRQSRFMESGNVLDAAMRVARALINVSENDNGIAVPARKDMIGVVRWEAYMHAVPFTIHQNLSPAYAHPGQPIV